jgi:hypothetical protein
VASALGLPGGHGCGIDFARPRSVTDVGLRALSFDWMSGAGSCPSPVELEARADGIDATRSSAGLTLAALAGRAVAGEVAGLDWAASSEGPSVSSVGVDIDRAAGLQGPSDSTSESLVVSATRY